MRKWRPAKRPSPRTTFFLDMFAQDTVFENPPQKVAFSDFSKNATFQLIFQPLCTIQLSLLSISKSIIRGGFHRSFSLHFSVCCPGAKRHDVPIFLCVIDEALTRTHAIVNCFEKTASLICRLEWLENETHSTTKSRKKKGGIVTTVIVAFQRWPQLFH